jgi:hypothetical protein
MGYAAIAETDIAMNFGLQVVFSNFDFSASSTPPR